MMTLKGWAELKELNEKHQHSYIRDDLRSFVDALIEYRELTKNLTLYEFGGDRYDFDDIAKELGLE